MPETQICLDALCSHVHEKLAEIFSVDVGRARRTEIVSKQADRKFLIDLASKIALQSLSQFHLGLVFLSESVARVACSESGQQPGHQYWYRTLAGCQCNRVNDRAVVQSRFGRPNGLQRSCQCLR